MPLNFFGGSSSQSKPQPLSSSEEDGKEKKEKKDNTDKDCRGTVLKLTKTTVTIEKKLAEGGFAIVYLVTDKQNRQYALKRQFIKDDPKQVEACKREFQIVSSLRDHKNIVCYADHFLGVNKSGVCDYMLLTSYYKANLLQWINERLSAGRGLSPSEVLAIFCDMCEAVARLHHSQTPVIHRDLKVENILIDERNRAAPPIYVLCDFGSATTKVMSSNTHPIGVIQEEIEKYTTLSYRAPEMIDIYEGKTIGTKVDTWAMGIMLYKLCYFSLPFGESALAIQNGSFTYPSRPEYPDSIKSIIKVLLDPEIDRRPSIFECSSLAFEASGRKCPVNNVYKMKPRRLSSVVKSFLDGSLLNSTTRTVSAAQPVESNSGKVLEVATAALCSTSPPQRVETTTTSVNPRLRPKPMASVPTIPIVPSSPQLSAARPNVIENRSSNSELSTLKADDNTVVFDLNPDQDGPLSCPIVKPQELGFTDLEDSMLRRRAQTDSSVAGPSSTFVEAEKAVANPCKQSSDVVASSEFTGSQPVSTVAQSHRRHMSDTTQITKSAFKPYSQTVAQSSEVSSTSANDVRATDQPNQSSEDQPDSWNPFLAAPFGSQQGMDDSHFGHEFDELPRKTEKNDAVCDSDATSIDSLDPFGAAPFEMPPQVVPEPVTQSQMDNRDSVGSAEDLKQRMQEEDSELDEQRMMSRRRYSYEHIDGVGEEGSSDSRGRTEGEESTDELSRNGESSYDEENDSSQQTDVASDDGGGRPLLEDEDYSEEEEEEDTPQPVMQDVRNRQSAWDQSDVSKVILPPLSIEDPSRNTNPFLNSDATPKMSPAQNEISKDTQPRNPFLWEESLKKPVVTTVPTAFSPPQPPAACVFPVYTEYAPATLPRQSTPLSAVPKGAQQLSRNKVSPYSVAASSQPPQTTVVQSRHQPVAAAAFQSTTSTMAQTPLPLTRSTKNEASNLVPPNLELKKSTSPSSKMISLSFVEGPKTPKFKEKEKKSKEKAKKKFERFSSGSEFETDGSEAEMCSSISSDKAFSKKKKKTSTFGVRSSNPSIAPHDGVIKKSSEKRKVSSSSGAKRGSGGAVNASFVNSSFQAEDIDSPPTIRSARL